MSLGDRKNILTIAGFDPSSGAGLTSDIKTFENLKCYGFAVQTANTIQSDSDFINCFWTELSVMKQQIDLLFKSFEIDFVKIGIIENWQTLNKIIDYLLGYKSDLTIVLDPVLSSSSQFLFHSSDSRELDKILEKIYLITPNYLEIQSLYENKDLEETILHMQSLTNVFLKGGHRTDFVGLDELYLKNGTKHEFLANAQIVKEKHGSGCVLSSAILAYLALGNTLIGSCDRAKAYTELFLNSNNTLLGTHPYLKT